MAKKSPTAKKSATEIREKKSAIKKHTQQGDGQYSHYPKKSNNRTRKPTRGQGK